MRGFSSNLHRGRSFNEASVQTKSSGKTGMASASSYNAISTTVTAHVEMGLLSLGVDESRQMQSDSNTEGLRLEKSGNNKKNTFSINLDPLKNKLVTTKPGVESHRTSVGNDDSIKPAILTKSMPTAPKTRTNIPSVGTGQKLHTAPPSETDVYSLLKSILEPDQKGLFLFKIDFTIDGVPAPLTVRGGDSPESAANEWVVRHNQRGSKNMIVENVLKATEEFLQVSPSDSIRDQFFCRPAFQCDEVSLFLRES
jgi:hypothetical protein